MRKKNLLKFVFIFIDGNTVTDKAVSVIAKNIEDAIRYLKESGFRIYDNDFNRSGLFTSTKPMEIKEGLIFEHRTLL